MQIIFSEDIILGEWLSTNIRCNIQYHNVYVQFFKLGSDDRYTVFFFSKLDWLQEYFDKFSLPLISKETSAEQVKELIDNFLIKFSKLKTFV